MVEAVFYGDVEGCLPLDPATCVRFPAGAGRIYLLFDMDKNVMKLTLFENISVSFFPHKIQTYPAQNIN